MKIISVLKQKYLDWRREVERQRELEAEMQHALIDKTLIERMHTGLFGFRHPSGYGFMRPLPEIDPAYRKGRTAVLGERAGY